MNLNEALTWADSGDYDCGATRPVETLAAEVRRLQAEVEALTAICNDLEEFAQHDGGCYLRHSGDKCDCGLLKAIKRLNERMGL